MHARCSKCRARRGLSKKPEDYIRPPRCPGCRRKMVAVPVRRTDPHWVIDRYRMRVERGRGAKTCDPSRGSGCRGYSFIHRLGFGFCDFNPRKTDQDHQQRENERGWS